MFKSICNQIGLIVILALLVSSQAYSHHSYTKYDRDKMQELEGELIEYTWRNPHVRLKMRAVNSEGNETIWQFETTSLSLLRRTDASLEKLKKGDKIKVAGWPTQRPSNTLFLLNLLTPEGQEILLGMGAKPRWSEDVLGDSAAWFDEGVTDQGNTSIFRVWSTDFDGSVFRMFIKDYPLTEIAKSKLAAWDPNVDTVTPGCSPKGMPSIMKQPYPIEFVRSGDDIVLHMEEYDTVRTIYMNRNRSDGNEQASILGYSTGLWDGATLVVKTNKINYPYTDTEGIPQGSDPSYVERFNVAEDGSRLDYQLVVTDDEVYTEPVTITRDWVWRPGVKVEPYECDWGEIARE